MKKILILTFILGAHAAWADLITTCPTGYTTINIPDALFMNTCPAGTTAFNNKPGTCLIENPTGVCGMFIPIDMELNDISGAYYYVNICPLS